MSLAADLRRHLVPVLPEYLSSQRWYGDKGRGVRATSIVDLASADGEGDSVALAVVEVRFGDGGDARYFLPLAVLLEAPRSAVPLATVETAAGRRVIVDAFSSPAFPSWLLHRLADGAEQRGARGAFRWCRLPELERLLPRMEREPARIGAVEQSNTSVRYGDALFLKVFRRLRPGINPDDEIGRFLATKTDFRRTPLPLGTATWSDGDGTTYPLALAQGFVKSVGDGWSYVLNILAPGGGDRGRTGEAFDGAAHCRGEGFMEDARRLGERTGQLHVALASDDGDPAFAPELVTLDDALVWETGAISSLRATAAALQNRVERLSPALRRRIVDFDRLRPELERRARGFRALVGQRKIRVHGDYHLGQVLRTPDDDWVILDFEGEPARSIEERRAKTSPLKDVAGMLRSFGYARGAALRAVPEADRSTLMERSLAAWEGAARTAFLNGYRSETTGHSAGLVPTDQMAFDSAVAAWELDKALYEIIYELGNRPDWLDLPLDALLVPPHAGAPTTS